MNLIEVKSIEECKRLGSAFTMEGLCTNDESLNQLKDWINERTTLLKDNIYVISGKNMNTWYGLTGTNAYPDDTSIICIDLDDIEDINAIVFARFQIGARWLDDVIENNLRYSKNISTNYS